MNGGRTLSVGLVAALVMLSPGPHVWAQVARAVSSVGVGGQPAAVGPAAAPVSSAARSPISEIKLSGTLSGITLPQAAPLSISADAKTQAAPASPSSMNAAQTPQVQDAASMAAPIWTAAPIVQAAPSSDPSKAKPEEKADPLSGKGETDLASKGLAVRGQTLADETEPLIRTMTSPKSAAAAVVQSGQHLQDLLQGRTCRHTVAALPDGPSSPLGSDPSRLDFLLPNKLVGHDGTSASAESRAPPAASAPELTPQQKSRFRFYAAGVAAVKVGVETLSLALPVLLLSQLHAAMAISALFLAAELAGIASNFMGGAIVDRIGAGKVMVFSAFAQAALIGALPLVLVMGGPWVMPAVYALFIANGVFSEVFEVARRTKLPELVGNDENALRKYNGSLYVWREIAAVTGVLGAGWILTKIGALGAIWIHPVFVVLAGFVLLRAWKSRPAPAAPAQAAPVQPTLEKRPTAVQALMGWWEDLLAGLKTLKSNKKLGAIVLINVPLTVIHKIFHALVAVIYAAQILGNPALAAVLLGAWNLGELAGAWSLHGKGHESRISNWLLFAGVASLLTWGFFLSPSIWIAAPASFIIAAAMLGNELGIAAYMQSSVPQQELGAVTGFVHGFARGVSMLGLLLTGLAFDTFGAVSGFLGLAIVFSLAAPVYLIASRFFRHDNIPKPASSDEA